MISPYQGSYSVSHFNPFFPNNFSGIAGGSFNQRGLSLFYWVQESIIKGGSEIHLLLHNSFPTHSLSFPATTNHHLTMVTYSTYKLFSRPPSTQSRVANY